MLNNVLELVHQVQPFLRAAQLYTSKIKLLEDEIQTIENSIAIANSPRVTYTNSGSGFQSIHSGRGT